MCAGIPPIPTIHGYPIELAAQVAVTSVRSAAPANAAIAEVIFCCFSVGDLAVYERILREQT